MTQVVVTVMPKEGVLDPQGQAVRGALAAARLRRGRERAHRQAHRAGDRRRRPRRAGARDVRAAAGERPDRGLPVEAAGVSRCAIVRFPGSLDHDSARRAVERPRRGGRHAWHADPELPAGHDAPCCCPAASPTATTCAAAPSPAARRSWPPCGATPRRGGRVIGICNGFQVLCEAGLLPGALRRNATLSFVCRQMDLEVADAGHPLDRRPAGGLEPLDPDQEQRGRLVRRPVRRRGWCCATGRQPAGLHRPRRRRRQRGRERDGPDAPPRGGLRPPARLHRRRPRAAGAGRAR